MEQLYLGTNSLASSIPLDLCTGGLGALSALSLGHSQLTGTVPPECFSDLASLVEFRVEGTEISGTIATEVGLLAQTVVTLHFANTSMTGTIPKEASDLSLLQTINVEGTEISGEIPQALCEISGLEFDCTELLCECNCTCDVAANQNGSETA